MPCTRRISRPALLSVDVASTKKNTRKSHFFSSLLEEATKSNQEKLRIRRKVVDRIALRDRPILNKFQGAIFRLPLDRQVMLFGPPGSGKTTTLIKRLAQKRTPDALTDGERRSLAGSLGQDILRPDSWAMFSPAELLRQYLGDAFNKEGVPDAGNVRTWDKERHDLARNVFNILRSNGPGGFQLHLQETTVLSDWSSAGIAHLHDAFASEVDANLLKRCEDAIFNLLSKGDEASRKQAARIQTSLGNSKKVSIEDALRVFGQSDALQTEIKRLGNQITDELNKAVNLLLNRHRSLIDEIATALPSINASEDEDEDEDDENIDAIPAANTRTEALYALMTALRTWSRAISEGRKTVGRQTRRVLEVVGNRMLSDEHFSGIGSNIAIRSWLRTLVQAPRIFVLGVPRLYARFRRQNAGDETLFIRDKVSKSLIAKNLITRDEADVLLLVMLRNARRVLQAGNSRRLESTVPYDWLEVIKGRYLTQVFVDEATDLSAVQLACTIELADPRLRSWFACGDLRQRITINGLQNEAEIEWLNRTSGIRIELRKVEIGYRQSHRLRNLSDEMANLLDGTPNTQTTTPPGAEEADAWPLLVEGYFGKNLGAWLAERIHEVEREIGRLPSIAVFVDGDGLIDPLLEHTAPILAGRNIPIVGCKEGRIVGDAREVRVFDIQHIKGLEFEAVFFVGIDKMAKRMPDLFQRYIYVGLTRAATYLGISCEGKLPSKLAPLRRHFSSMPGWSDTSE